MTTPAERIIELEEQMAKLKEENASLRRLVEVYMNDVRRRLDPELSAILAEFRSQQEVGSIESGTFEAPEGAIVLKSSPVFSQPEIIADLEDRLYQALVQITEFRAKCDPGASVVPVTAVEALCPIDE